MRTYSTDHYLGIAIYLLMFAFGGQAFAATKAVEEAQFPGREMYSTVTPMSIDELHQKLGDVNIIDVRSFYEFDTLHIQGAVHIALNDPSFEAQVRELWEKNQRPLVFYCNGKTCYKSYMAAYKAMEEKISQVYAYDAGIFEWAKTYPDQAVLLGKSPINPARLISRNQFKSHLISPEKFAERAYSSDVAILDVRDRDQQAGDTIFPHRQHMISLDDKRAMGDFIDSVRKERKILLVYDEAGKQVRWFQYFLEHEGVASYMFMDGGAKAFYEKVLMMDDMGADTDTDDTK